MGKLMHVLWAWLSKHKLEITAMLGFVLFAVPWMVPPRYFEFYELQMRMRLPFACSGILFIPVLICLLPFFWTQESSVNFQIIGIVFSIIWVGALGWTLASVVKSLFAEHLKEKARRWAIVIAAVSFTLNLPCSLCTLMISGPLYSSESCSAFFSSTRGIHVVTYTAKAFSDVPYRNTFFLATEDNGKDWQQKIYIPDGIWEAELCRNLTTLNGTLVWTWSYGQLFRSDDGGNTWQTLRAPAQHGNYNDQVVFENYQNGYLTYEFNDGEMKKYLTSDGGKTWRRAEKEIREGSSE